MFRSFNRFFQDRLAPADGASDDARRLQVATCALLLEVAHADDEFSREERGKIDELIGRRFNLDPEETAELLAAAEQARSAEEDLYGFSRLINENYTHPRKLAILELLWEVVFSDGVLEAHEDALMHKMGTLLGVRHEELMAVKLRVKKKLERS